MSRKVSYDMARMSHEDEFVGVKLQVRRGYLEKAAVLAEQLTKEQPALAMLKDLTRERVLQMALHLGLDDLAAAQPGDLGPGRKRR